MIGVAVSPERAAVQVFPLRDGRMVDRYSFHLENAAGEEPARCSSSSASSTTAPPPRSRRRSWSRAARGIPRALEAFLSERRGSRVEVRVPERGEKRRLQELAQQNAELALASETFVAETKRARRVEALEELREALNLESLPIRIECFDISNIQGQEIVGSMVVFEDARREEGALPQVRVRGVEGQDDFASMARGDLAPVLAARRRPRPDDWNESFAATPNLVVIDGGKGQLSAALAAMHELDLPRVAVIALAKRIEEVFVPGRPDPILLPEHSPACSSCSGSATRRTASRSRSTGQRRDARRARVDVRPARGRRPGAPPRAAAALRLGRAGRSLRSRRSSRACRACRRRRRGGSTSSCTARARGLGQSTTEHVVDVAVAERVGEEAIEPSPDAGLQQWPSRSSLMPTARAARSRAAGRGGRCRRGRTARRGTCSRPPARIAEQAAFAARRVECLRVAAESRAEP